MYMYMYIYVHICYMCRDRPIYIKKRRTNRDIQENRPPLQTCSISCGRAATHCNTLQHTATHCNTLQHTATHCNTLRHTATHCDTLQHTLQHTATHTATHCNTHCNTLYTPPQTGWRGAKSRCCRLARRTSPSVHIYVYMYMYK